MLTDEQVEYAIFDVVLTKPPKKFLNHAIYRAGYAAGLEAAAKACDQVENGRNPDGEVVSGVAWECAAAIRALKEKP